MYVHQLSKSGMIENNPPSGLHKNTREVIEFPSNQHLYGRGIPSKKDRDNDIACVQAMSEQMKSQAKKRGRANDIARVQAMSEQMKLQAKKRDRDDDIARVEVMLQQVKSRAKKVRDDRARDLIIRRKAKILKELQTPPNERVLKMARENARKQLEWKQKRRAETVKYYDNISQKMKSEKLKSDATKLKMQNLRDIKAAKAAAKALTKTSDRVANKINKLRRVVAPRLPSNLSKQLKTGKSTLALKKMIKKAEAEYMKQQADDARREAEEIELYNYLNPDLMEGYQ